MSDDLPETTRASNGRALGFSTDSPNSGSELRGLRDGFTVGVLFRSLRRHILLAASTAALALIVTAFLVYRSPSLYRAVAVLRMVSERRALTSAMQNYPPAPDHGVDPLLSMVQLLTSRTRVGEVVDSLGLRLAAVPLPRTRLLPLHPPRLSVLALRNVAIDSATTVDTLRLEFTDSSVIAIGKMGRASALYGEPLRIGSVGFSVPVAPQVRSATIAVLARDHAIDRILKNLKVVPRPGTNVIDLRYTDWDPALAQRVANGLAQSFEVAIGHSAQDQARRRRKFVGERLRVTDSLLASAEGNRNVFLARQQMARGSDSLASDQATLPARNVQTGELEADRRVFTMLLQRMESPGDEKGESFRALAYAPEVASDPVLGRLHEKLMDYGTRLDSLTTGPWRSQTASPDVVQLRELVTTTQNQFVEAVRARVASIDARLAVLGSARARGARSMRSLPAIQAREGQLTRRVEALRTTAEALRQEFEYARVAEALAEADIEVLDLAPLPYRPTGVPRPMALTLGLFLGLLLASGTSVLAEATNHSVRHPEELRQTLGIPALGLVPSLSTHRRLANGTGVYQEGTPSGEVVVGPSAVPSPGAEAFRMLRITLAFSHGPGPCILLVTSAAPQEGKTLIAANLAATFARGGARVLLVDADTHRSRLHRLFRTSRAPGLVELLQPVVIPDLAPTGAALHLHESIRRTSIDRLSLLPSGAVSARATELLEPKWLQSRLNQLRTHFDMIIIDSPPVLVSADAVTLAASADSVLLVVRAGRTEQATAEFAHERLTSAGARTLGAVLNDPDGVLNRLSHKLYNAYTYPATPD